MRSPGICGFITLRDKVHVDQVAGASNGNASGGSYPYFFKDIDRYQVDANNGSIVTQTDHFYSLNYLKPLYHTNKAIPLPIFGYWFGMAPEIQSASFGHMDFGNLHNPRVTIQTDAGIVLPGTNDQYLDVSHWTYQIIQVKSGDIVRVFN